MIFSTLKEWNMYQRKIMKYMKKLPFKKWEANYLLKKQYKDICSRFQKIVKVILEIKIEAS